MFLGYQRGKIVFTAPRRADLEKLPCVELDRIEETQEEYVLKDGVYVIKGEASES